MECRSLTSEMEVTKGDSSKVKTVDINYSILILIYMDYDEYSRLYYNEQ